MTPPEDPGRSGWLHNLAVALDSRFAASGRADDLDRALELFPEGLDRIGSA
jgi:hypothetical protein